MLSPLHKHALLCTFLHVENRLNEMEALACGKQAAFSARPACQRPVSYGEQSRPGLLRPHPHDHAGLPSGCRYPPRGPPHQFTLGLANGYDLPPRRHRRDGPRAIAGLRGLSTMPMPGPAEIQQDLNRLIDRISTYLRQGLGQDLQQRLARLEATPASIAILTILEQIVMRWQLVEFRPRWIRSFAGWNPRSSRLPSSGGSVRASPLC